MSIECQVSLHCGPRDDDGPKKCPLTCFVHQTTQQTLGLPAKSGKHSSRNRKGESVVDCTKQDDAHRSCLFPKSEDRLSTICCACSAEDAFPCDNSCSFHDLKIEWFTICFTGSPEALSCASTLTSSLSVLDLRTRTSTTRDNYHFAVVVKWELQGKHHHTLSCVPTP